MNIMPPLSQFEKDYFSFGDLLKKYSSVATTYGKLEKSLKTLNTSLLDCEKRISNLPYTWKGFLVKLLDGRTGFLKKIFEWLQNFEWFRNELSNQRSLKTEIAAIRTEHSIGQKSFDDLSQEFQPLKKTYLEYREKYTSKASAYQLMMKIFGGEENYLSFPTIDLKNRENNKDYIDFLKPDELKAPIVRFKDNFGREGIAIRTVRLSHGSVIDRNVQTFFQRHSNNSSAWSDSGDIPIHIEGHIIQEDGLAQQVPLLQLKELICLKKIKILSRSNNEEIEYKLA